MEPAALAAPANANRVTATVALRVFISVSCD
jgi:hypothetical protein